MKYNEDKILADVKSYVESTYTQHYSGSNGIQVNDLLKAIGHSEGAYISNAIEYLARYGKKDGKNVKDLYKAIHNIILLIEHNHTPNISNMNDSVPKTQNRVVTQELSAIENLVQQELNSKGLL